MNTTRVALDVVCAEPSKYLRQAIAGQTVVVTDGEKPLALIEPCSEELIVKSHEAETNDFISPAESGPIPAEFFEQLPIQTRQSVLAVLLEERRNGR